MYKAIVFAGTTEGYEVSRFLSEQNVPVYVCVATEYGAESLKESETLHVRAARLTMEEMAQLFLEVQPELVLDATHPYAAEVTRNIQNACEQTKMEYIRVLRAESDTAADAVYVSDVSGAVEFLKGTEGNVLLTTGSKELKSFTQLPGYQKRLYARVLSLPSVMNACAGLGFEGCNLIGMQGPFSRELNAAMLRQYNCRYLVTKDSGRAGGFEEKMEAARECGVTPVVIGRPLKESGISLNECKEMLKKRYFPEAEIPVEVQQAESQSKRKITLLGIGMGSEGTRTAEGQRALREADLIIGARRMVDSSVHPGQAVLYEYRSDVIAKYITEHPEYQKVVIALSGDVGFYSGAKKLLALLGDDVEILCGISSVSYFMAKLGLSWEDAKLVSAHGRACNLISEIAANEKVFAILGTSDGVSSLAQKLVAYGMGDVRIAVGENLSYPDEKIFTESAALLTDYVGNALSVICAVNEQAVKPLATHGLPDESFLRGKAPMTKEEVRAVSLAKLRLNRDSICYDVGAGTGSVSIEMALRAVDGSVYAIEKKEEACALLYENKKKFAVDNLTVISGLAPEALDPLPAPTHAFIGGSSGNLAQIVDVLLSKNPSVRMVINCITLETVSEAIQILKERPELQSEIVQVGVARSKEIAHYHMMMGENPIYVITAQKGAGHADS